MIPMNYDTLSKEIVLRLQQYDTQHKTFYSYYLLDAMVPNGVLSTVLEEMHKAGFFVERETNIQKGTK